ncbi:hypothetical protein PVAND_003925 [Polypedilum vanderplanki]|uniref:Uncharacterized protein n=1 Tax=Polypedilum vanderplanki TaxID=319348 RepID=A0A9J6BVK8_POLVA|nr:hypothetical protein PVAND_003925 [Polypedilum vanderplanki]
MFRKRHAVNIQYNKALLLFEDKWHIHIHTYRKKKKILLKSHNLVMKKKGQKGVSAEKKEVATEKGKEQNDTSNEEEINSGFSNYLHSSSGQEMLRMFVVVNSIVMFLTVAWPQMQKAYEFLAQIINENFGSIELF